MGRRKIEIKAIKDDRNRSVTFLKRKGGLFKKAHELSVLCSVDVAVFIFGNNKKLYEYSSSDMRDLVNRYQYHGLPNEHKGPGDFSGGNEDDDDYDGEGTPPRGHDGLEHQMMPPQFPGHQQPAFPQLRHQTPSASPPISNGGAFQAHPGRGTTPQAMVSRPDSRNDMRRIGPNMVSQPQGAHPVMSYMPTPPIYQPSGPPGGPGQPSPSQFPSYPPQHQHQQQQHHQQQQQHHRQHQQQQHQQQQHQQHQQHQQQQHQQQQHQQQQHQQRQHQQQQHHQQQHPQHQQNLSQSLPPPPPPSLPHQHPQQRQQHQTLHHPPYTDDRRASVQYAQPPSQDIPTIMRTEPTPSATSHQQMAPTISGSHISPPPPFDVTMEPTDRPQRPLLNTDTAIKKMPQKKSHSIFTPIEESRSILSQHLASFTSEAQSVKPDSAPSALNRSQSDASARGGSSASPQLKKRSNMSTSLEVSRTTSTSSSGAESSFTPPSRANSLQVTGGAAAGGPGAGPRPRGPRLTVQIPDGVSEPGSAGAESRSPHGSAITPTQAPRHGSVVLPPPPPSPSASALLSAGATGPPNPFARPPPQQTVNMNGETPVSALPSRFLHGDLLPSPSALYQDWPFRGHDSNTLPSPLNFATPLAGTGPSFLRDDQHVLGGSGGGVMSTAAAAAAAAAGLGALGAVGSLGGVAKRKTPEGEEREGAMQGGNGEGKRLKVQYS
ncbi:hypothetical protein E4U60_000430 [Claviceps pazoutovae]|uniref:MADS-box MEF2 type transcription factor MIG1 n=1 Tax=Claviceps pazoutovae TaxID=1649127 RepID=A0A9P7MEG1_9HYPO|nr:hypothetical protein E4U60_000430 [Claviceps pazoutovae]